MAGLNIKPGHDVRRVSGGVRRLPRERGGGGESAGGEGAGAWPPGEGEGRPGPAGNASRELSTLA